MSIHVPGKLSSSPEKCGSFTWHRKVSSPCHPYIESLFTVIILDECLTLFGERE